MTDQHPTLLSFPPRPLSMVEIETLEERDRIQSIIEGDFTVEDEEDGLQVSVHDILPGVNAGRQTTSSEPRFTSFSETPGFPDRSWDIMVRSAPVLVDGTARP